MEGEEERRRIKRRASAGDVVVVVVVVVTLSGQTAGDDGRQAREGDILLAHSPALATTGEGRRGLRLLVDSLLLR